MRGSGTPKAQTSRARRTRQLIKASRTKNNKGHRRGEKPIERQMEVDVGESRSKSIEPKSAGHVACQQQRYLTRQANGLREQ